MVTLEEMQQFESFKVEIDSSNRILTMTFNRPPLHTFVKGTYGEIKKILSHVAENENICAVIFNSTGKIFSAGADVRGFSDPDLQEKSIRRAILRDTINAFYACPVPLIAAVQGAAVGAGATFAACADIIFASEEASFALAEINVGVIGGAIGLARLFPPQKVRFMCLTGLPVSAVDTHRFGGVEAIVPQEELYETAMKHAELIADKGSRAVRMWKESLLVTEGIAPREALLIEQCLSQELGTFHVNPKARKQRTIS